MRTMSEPWDVTGENVTFRRTWGKTFLVSVLLLLLPFVGWSMATHYVMTRDDPNAYAPKQAAAAGAVLFVFIVIVYVIVGIITRPLR